MMLERDDTDIVIALDRYLINKSTSVSMIWIEYHVVDTELGLPAGSTKRLLGQAVELHNGWTIQLAGATSAKITT